MAAIEELTLRPVRPADYDRIVEITQDVWEGHDYIPRVFDRWVSDSAASFQAAELRRRLVGQAGPRLPRFSELFMLLVQMGIAPDVNYLRYPIVTRYSDMEEALTDCGALFGEGWDETAARAELERLLRREGEELVYDGGLALSGVAHWQPSKS